MAKNTAIPAQLLVAAGLLGELGGTGRHVVPQAGPARRAVRAVRPPSRVRICGLKRVMPRWRAPSDSLAAGTSCLKASPTDARCAGAPLGVERAVLVDAAVGVRAEEVPLRLDQGSRQPFGTNAVVVGQRG